MTDIAIGTVVTTCEGRETNLLRTLEHLDWCEPAPAHLVVVFDGCAPVSITPARFPVTTVRIQKHQPGAEQPRNVGVRTLGTVSDATHAWLLDSDLIFGPDILARFLEAYACDPVRFITCPERREESVPGPRHDRVLMGPYEWLGPDQFDMPEDYRTDIRWASFMEHGRDTALVHDLGAGLGCFGGNLVWPMDAFRDIGGFHPELHHGRCEDGELGLRAASAGVPMTMVRDARAWHVMHPVNGGWVMATNARDVPLLNSWHPWVQDQGFLLTESDGARFDFRCGECDTVMNSHDYWSHVSWHRGTDGGEMVYADPASVRSA